MSKIGSLFGGGDDGAGDVAAQRQAEEAERQARIRQGQQAIDAAFAGFGDDFYENRAQAYRDYYLPQLDRQFKDAGEQLVFSLSRAGQPKSTAANTATADLQRQYNEQRGAILDRAEGYAGDIRGQVDQQRNTLVNQLLANANPDIAASAALNASRAIRDTTPQFSPLTAVLAPLAVGGANFVQGRRDAQLLAGTGVDGLSATNPRAVGRTISVTS